MMKKYSIIIIYLFISVLIKAEKIDGPANVRSEPQGSLLFSLFDNVEIECSEINNNWYNIGLSIKLSKIQHDREIPLLKGDTLFDFEGNAVGLVLADITGDYGYRWMSGGAPGNPKCYGMQLYGYTYRSNIRPESIPETRLKIILDKNFQPIKKENLSQFIEEYEFIAHGLLKYLDESYTEYMIYESTMDDPSPMDRIRLILQDNELIAVVYTRKITEKYPIYELVRGRKIMIIKDMSKSETVNFVQLNIKSYEGVD